MDFKKQTTEELRHMIAGNREKLQAFRFAMSGGKTKNVKEGRNLRKDIARFLTELQKRKSETLNPKS